MPRKPEQGESSEFLWLISLSDLMILLFIFFVVLYSFSAKKMNQSDVAKVLSVFKNEKVADPVQNIEVDVRKWVKDSGLKDQVDVTTSDGTLSLEIKDQVLFGSGRHQIHSQGATALRNLKSVLERIPAPYQLGIEGHTDDTPIHTDQVRDNWELASRRAHSVFMLLNLSEDLRKRTVLMSHGPMKPIANNRDDQGRPILKNQIKNRRVTLRVF